MNITIKKLESQYFKLISQIINYEITNSRLSFTTITDVALSKNGRHLTVYVTFKNNSKKSLDALISTRGFIRSRLFQNMSVKKIPDISFKLDLTFEKGQKIERILDNIFKDNK